MPASTTTSLKLDAKLKKRVQRLADIAVAGERSVPAIALRRREQGSSADARELIIRGGQTQAVKRTEHT